MTCTAARDLLADMHSKECVEANIQRAKMATRAQLRADLFRSQLAALTPPLLILPSDADAENIREAIEARVKLAWQYVGEAYPLYPELEPPA